MNKVTVKDGKIVAEISYLKLKEEDKGQTLDKIIFDESGNVRERFKKDAACKNTVFLLETFKDQYIDTLKSYKLTNLTNDELNTGVAGITVQNIECNDFIISDT